MLFQVKDILIAICLQGSSQPDSLRFPACESHVQGKSKFDEPSRKRLPPGIPSRNVLGELGETQMCCIGDQKGQKLR
jgi:hypothetical protein